MSTVPASDPLVPDGDEPVLDRDEVTLPRAAFHTPGAGSRVTLLGAGFRPLLHSAGLSTEALPATRPNAQREAAVTFSGRCSPGDADCASPPEGSIALVASPTLLPGLQGVPLNVSEPDRTPGGLSATSYASTSAHSTLRVVTGDTSDDEDEDASGNGGSCSTSLRELPVIEHYETVRVLGSGAFGTVKLIRIQRGDSERAEFAALKAPLAARGPHAARHLAIARREVAVLPLLRHRHIVRCIGTVSDAPLAVALECCSLGDLHDATLALRPSASPTTLRRWRRTVRQAGCEASPSRVFPKGRGLPEELVWIVITHVGEALRYLHYEAGVVHRDVKPKNLLIADDGRVKLCDFGSSVSFFTPEQHRGSHDESAPVRVKNVAFNGSVNYAAPELLDQAPFDGRADVWALGCTAFEMMSGGARAFPGRSIAEVIGRVCCGSRAKLTCAATGYSAKLCAVVESMLAIDADVRTTSAELAHVCPSETYETALHSRALAYALAAKREHQDAQTGFATRAERAPSCHASASEAESLDSASEGDGDASPPAALPKPASVHSLGAAAVPCAATSIDGDGGCSFSALIPTA